MTEQTTGQLTVELADLRGWADQVGRAGGDCEQLAGYLSTFVPDGDFGRLLSLLTPDYEALVVRVRDVLEVDGARLAGTRAGLRHVARRYERTDDRVARTFGGGVRRPRRPAGPGRVRRHRRHRPGRPDVRR